jgi:PAS domain S-box-containing protein
LNRHTYILLFLLPLLSVLAMGTNDFHHLIWTGFRMGRHVIADHGKLYWLFNSYVYLLGIVNLAVLLHLAIRSPRHRRPVAIIVSGQIIVRVTYTLDKLDADLIGPGESIFIILGLMSVVYALAILRFHAVDPVAVSRTAALQQMREGMLVLDPQGRIVDVNPMAAAMLGTSEIQLRQKLAADVLPVDAGLLEQSDNNGIGHADISLAKDNSVGHYALNLTPLKAPSGESIGQLLLLHDTTDQKRAHARILEQQGVVATLRERERLSRELHDGIGQVLGYVAIQTQACLKWLREERMDKAESILKRLVEVAQDAHADVRESILSLRTDPGKEWAFISSLENYLDRFQANYGIRAELTLPDRTKDRTFDPVAGVQLLRVIQEAMTNARKHSHARTLRVCVETDRREVHVTIADDGNGFDVGRPQHDRDNHFGLVFMRERMEQIGGSLSIDSVPGSGTILRLSAPIRKEAETQ